MSKYKEYFQEMVMQNKEVFDAFKKLHDNYVRDPKKFQKEFEAQRAEMMLLIQRHINRLCMKMESGKYGKFSSTLADKFWQEVRIHLPKIDELTTS